MVQGLRISARLVSATLARHRQQTPAPVTDLLRPQFAIARLNVDAFAALKALHLDVPLPPALLVAESSVLKDDLVTLRDVHLSNGAVITGRQIRQSDVKRAG